jgi:hypothetical protein
MKIRSDAEVAEERLYGTKMSRAINIAKVGPEAISSNHNRQPFGRQDYENKSWNLTFDFKTSSGFIAGLDAVHGITAIGLVAGLDRITGRKRETLWRPLSVSAA